MLIIGILLFGIVIGAGAQLILGENDRTSGLDLRVHRGNRWFAGRRIAREFDCRRRIIIAPERHPRVPCRRCHHHRGVAVVPREERNYNYASV